MYKIHRIFFGYESKQMPNALTPSEAALVLSKNPGVFSVGKYLWLIRSPI